MICPGFVADCLETLEEIAQEAREAFLEAGGQRLPLRPCLNDDPAWITALADLAEQRTCRAGRRARHRHPTRPSAPRAQRWARPRLSLATPARQAPGGAQPPAQRHQAGSTSSTSTTTSRNSRGRTLRNTSSGLRRWTARCASAPRPAARDHADDHRRGRKSKRRITTPSRPMRTSGTGRTRSGACRTTPTVANQDAGVQVRPRDLQQLDPQAHQRQVQHQQHHVADVERRSAPTPAPAFWNSCGPG